MKLLRKLPFHSLQFRLIFGFSVMFVPIISFLIYSNVYAIQVVRNQITQSNENMMALYMGQIDSNLARVEEYLYNLAAEDTDLIYLDLPEAGNNQQYYFSKIQLWQKISRDSLNFKTIDAFFIYSGNNKELIMTQNLSLNTRNENIVEEEIQQKFQTGEIQAEGRDGWFTPEVNGSYYLCRVVRVGNVYVGALAGARKC